MPHFLLLWCLFSPENYFEVAIGPVTGHGSRGYWSGSRDIREIDGNTFNS